jgi:hypothetical protein
MGKILFHMTIFLYGIPQSNLLVLAKTLLQSASRKGIILQNVHSHHNEIKPPLSSIHG